MKKNTRTKQMVDNMHSARFEHGRSYPVLKPMYEREAVRLSRPESVPEICKGEVAPAADDLSDKVIAIRNTLTEPDTPAIDASLDRLDLLQRSGALEVGIDAANSIQARNSLEKMLAHQMASCHVRAMEMISQRPTGFGRVEQELLIKRMSLAAKLMDTYQRGLEVLTKTRTAGKQTVVVKQVHVSGGQAVITDTMTTGGHEEGGSGK